MPSLVTERGCHRKPSSQCYDSRSLSLIAPRRLGCEGVLKGLHCCGVLSRPPLSMAGVVIGQCMRAFLSSKIRVDDSIDLAVLAAMSICQCTSTCPLKMLSLRMSLYLGTRLPCVLE
jgi:hypothetical protein